jgi:hypothetical protein
VEPDVAGAQDLSRPSPAERRRLHGALDVEPEAPLEVEEDVGVVGGGLRVALDEQPGTEVRGQDRQHLRRFAGSRREGRHRAPPPPAEGLPRPPR